MTKSEPTPAPATPRRTRMSAAERRATILDAAIEVFAELGYQRSKISTIAARVGVSEPVVFQNFGSKSALFAAVLQRAADQLADNARPALEADQSVLAFLTEQMSPQHLEALHAHGSAGVLFSDAMGLTADPEVAAAARSAVQRVAEVLADLINKGQQAGELRQDLDPNTGAWWLLSLLAAHRFRAAVLEDHADLEEQLATLSLETLTGPASKRASG
ncbi:TetR family transcriptional regulator [Streptomyces sp. NPDC056149]|uniref:TetR/AcrR family transcriptional regulator n=1 Tax=unclassified Streptomyces TaxID=2593676 RepID=UPI00238190F9|nr:TetR/AcrR family transcriptional regulator [Streptomyces sp. WZ-12]